MLTEPCPERKQGPCRPKPWSTDEFGFLDVMVMQCVFCKKQVIYEQSAQKEIAKDVTDHNVGVVIAGNGVFLH